MTLATIAMLLASALPGAQDAPAEEWPDLSYTFAQLEYREPNNARFAENADGFSLAGSVALSEVWHLFGESVFGRGRALGTTVETRSYALGLGAHASLDPRTDLVAELGFLGTEVEALGTRRDEGALLSVAVRLFAAPEVELEGEFAYTDVERLVGETSVNFGGVIHVAEHVGLVGNLTLGDDGDVFSVGLRVFR